MNSTCQQGMVQPGEISVVVWGVYCWHIMDYLIRLEAILTGNRCVSILSDHLHAFMCSVKSEGFGRFHPDNALYPKRQELLPSGCMNALLILDISIFAPPKYSDMNITQHI